MSDRKRTTVRMYGEIKNKAAVLMRHLSFTNFTAFIEQLVRDEWDRRVAQAPALEAQLRAATAPESDLKPGPGATGGPASSRTKSARGNLRKSPRLPKG